MGQRFQIIAINKKERAAFHHQWLYGASAVNVALDALNYAAEDPAGDGSPLVSGHSDISFADDLLHVLSNIYRGAQRDKKEVECILDITDELVKDNYRMGDNNDGVLILDLREFAKPRYCFLSNSNVGSDRKPNPLSGAAYVKTYYSTIHKDEETKEWYGEIKKGLAKFTLLKQQEVMDLFPQVNYQ